VLAFIETNSGFVTRMMVNYRDRTETLIVSIRPRPSHTMTVVHNWQERASPGCRQNKCPESRRSYDFCNMDNVINKLTKNWICFYKLINSREALNNGQLNVEKRVETISL